jgi:hypothetical protein
VGHHRRLNMGKHQESITPDRLIDASIAVLRVVAEEGARKAPGPYPADLMGSTRQPACLSQFKKWEVEEASAFLVRMGMLEPRRPRAA